jgi:N-acetylmuramoyl-L-alanine amidase
MKKIKVIFLSFLMSILLWNVPLNATTDLEKYQFAKKNYITAIFKNDKQKEEQYLKDLILYGKKANQDISKYKNELYRIDNKSKKPPKIKIENHAEQKRYEEIKDENILSDLPVTLSKEKEQFIKSSINYDIKSIEVKEDTIVINFSKKISKNDIQFSKRKEKNGYLYMFNISGNFRDAETTNLKIDGISNINISQETDDLLHLSIFNEEDAKTYYLLLDKKIIIKNKIKEEEKKISEDTPLINEEEIPLPFDMPKKTNNKAKVIVIDAGHGGKDPGAVGPNNEQEKVVVLKIAQYLYNNLKALGYQPYLTRDDDRYLTLKERTSLANKKNADLFVSVHANAVTKDRVMYARGIETYFLSPARSDRAKGVAALENKEDMEAMDSFNDQDLVLTLLNRGKTVQSQKMAIDVQSHILYQLRKRYGKEIIDNGVREAPFWVLVGAQMPAVLVEVGYISHPEESKLLISDTYQQEMANGIAEGITAYFIHNR